MDWWKGMLFAAGCGVTFVGVFLTARGTQNWIEPRRLAALSFHGLQKIIVEGESVADACCGSLSGR